jgi:hypothetical protein
MPGVAVEKNVSVTNTQDESWVRVIVETTITSAEGKTLGDTITHGEENQPVVQFDGMDEDVWQKKVDENGDLYYYHLSSLGQGEESQPLFTAVTLNPYLPNDYQDCDVQIVLTAQAVQVKNNEGTDNTALTVSGWPKN